MFAVSFGFGSALTISTATLLHFHMVANRTPWSSQIAQRRAVPPRPQATQRPSRQVYLGRGASTADARETLHSAVRNCAHRAAAASSSASWPPASRTARSDQADPSLFGDGGAPCRVPIPALSVPRRSSILGDPTARSLPEMPREPAETAFEPRQGPRHVQSGPGVCSPARRRRSRRG